MLQTLPVEVIQQIVSYLPSASSITNLALANHKLHDIISQDDYNIFRSFVQRAFPTIKTPPLWRDAARALTSRSRAWDRRAFVARECHPPRSSDSEERVMPGQSIGYHPVIDSYESWHGSSWSARTEVLVWGAGGRLRLRTIKDGVTKWSSFKIPEDHRQELDILDVRLLRPHQHQNDYGEAIILRRANGEVLKVESSEKADHFTQISRYIINDARCMSVSKDTTPLLAIGGTNSHKLDLYQISSSERNVRPCATIGSQKDSLVAEYPRCISFLSNNTIAVGMQGLPRQSAPILIYDITPTGPLPTSHTSRNHFTETSSTNKFRRHANVIVPLDTTSSSNTNTPTTVFLSGWSDGLTRLHDLRTPGKSIAELIDHVDDGQILSLLPIGRERFLAGSHQNGCLKTFDLRMPGARCYSYLDARPASASASKPPPPPPTETPNPNPHPRRDKDINIFITPHVPTFEHTWHPLPRRPTNRTNRYRGSIYALSSPSPTSPTVYVGISNHIIQLDYISTDDYHRRNDVPGLIDPNLNLSEKANNHHFLNLSCYERPRKGRESTDPVLLLKQTAFPVGKSQPKQGRTQAQAQAQVRAGQGGNTASTSTLTPTGWDERWAMEQYSRSNWGR